MKIMWYTALCISYLSKAPPLWCQLLAGSTPGGEEIDEPKLVFCFPADFCSKGFGSQLLNRGIHVVLSAQIPKQNNNFQS